MVQKLNTVLAAALFLVFLTGCGGGGGAGSSSGGAGDDGVVRYGAIGAKVRGMDPMDIGDTTSSGIASNIYDTLYQYHYLKRPYELIPSLAAEMPSVSEDGLTYTIPLRRDVYFADDACFAATGGQGRRVVAGDFIYSWKRIADIKNLSKNWWIFDGRIVGLDDFREYTKGVKSKGEVDYGRAVEGLEAVDDHTLRIKLTKPAPQVVYLLSHLPTAVVAREAVEHYGDEFLNHPVGTGPYVLETWDRGSKIVLVRNPTFRDERYPTEGEAGDEAAGLLADAGKRLPFIDRAEFQIIEEDQPYWLKFMAGEVDVAGIPKDSFDQAITPGRTLSPELARKGVVLSVFEDPATFWYGFNMEDPVIGKNLPLRRAMNLAIDRGEYIKLFLNDRGTPARGILPPMFEDYSTSLESPYTVYDPEEARRQLAEARKVHGGDLPVITLTMGGTDTTARQTGQYLKRAYAKIGLDFEVDYMDWPSAQNKVKSKSAQMYAMGWIADYPDSENFMLLFYGPNASPGANNMNYRNPEFDALYERVATASPSAERTEMVREMEQMVVDDLPCVLTVHRIAFVLRYDWVKNSKPHVFGYGLMKYQNIDVGARRLAVGR